MGTLDCGQLLHKVVWRRAEAADVREAAPPRQTRLGKAGGDRKQMSLRCFRYMAGKTPSTTLPTRNLLEKFLPPRAGDGTRSGCRARARGTPPLPGSQPEVESHLSHRRRETKSTESGWKKSMRIARRTTRISRVRSPARACSGRGGADVALHVSRRSLSLPLSSASRSESLARSSVHTSLPFRTFLLLSFFLYTYF